MEAKEHKIILENRNNLKINEIDEINSFDDEEIRVKLTQGELLIKGEKLNITKLDLQEKICEITGIVVSLMYVKMREKGEKSIFAKIMK